MAADAEQPSDSTWILGSFTKPEGEDLSVSFLREVSDEERAALQKAAQFLRSVHGGAGYQSFVLAARDVEERVGRLQATRSPVEHAALQRAIEIACKLARDCADKIVESIGGYELLEEAARTGLTGEIREYRSGAAALALCESIANGAPVAVVEQPNEQGFAVRAGSRDLDPLRLIAGTAAELQTMLALQLRGLAPAISEASLTLRNGTAEVLDGAPCLFRRAAGEQGKPGQMNVQPDDLALGIIAPLQRLVGRAEQLLAAPQPATESVEEGSHQPAAEVPADTDSAEEPPRSSEQEDSGQEVVPPGVLDLRSVVERLGSMTDGLERAWSDALSQVEGAEAHRDLLAEWRSLLQSIGHWVQTRSAELKSQGVDTEIPPRLLALDPEVVEAPPTTDQEAWTQLQVAQFFAVKNLGEAFGALAQPSHIEMSLDERNQETLRAWWEAGAFAAANQAARFVLRLQDEIDAVEARLNSRSLPERSALVRTFERLELAAAALSAGDPEGALLHLNLAYRALLASDSTTFDEEVERLANDPSSALLATAARKVSALAAHLTAGDAVDLGAVTVTVMMGASQLQDRLMGHPHASQEPQSD